MFSLCSARPFRRLSPYVTRKSHIPPPISPVMSGSHPFTPLPPASRWDYGWDCLPTAFIRQTLADWTTCTGALSYSPAPGEPARGVNGSRLLLGVFPRCARVTGPGALPDATSAPAKASIASATDSLRLRPPLNRTAHAGLTVSVCIPTVAAGERGVLRRIRRGRASVESFPAA